MVTHNAVPPVPGSRSPRDVQTPSGTFVEYDEFIESQLRKTRGHVRTVDIAASAMTLAAGTLAYFFVAALIDHWVIAGGLGFWGRLLLLAIYLVVAAYYIITQILPLLLRRINPLYAAHAIERSRPSLKNALVNFLTFRANPQGLSNVIYQAIEEQAATGLVAVRVESAVDRSKLIHIGYALSGILLACALYTLLSPKDLFKTVSRVVMPWSDLSAPTQTTIGEIEPGDVSAFRGQQVPVSARIQSLPAGGKVTLFYSTADRQIVDRPVAMHLPPDGYKHTCTLPASDAALQQSLEYRIEAGDAVSKRFHLDVVAAPTMVVRSVEYEYPSYTGLLAQHVQRQGDIKAIEGTKITLHAIANQDIVSAQVDFDCDDKPDLRMQVAPADPQQAEAGFQLSLKDDRQTPTHDSYQLLFKNAEGHQNPQPVVHQIEVTRDVPPEIQFVSPRQDQVDVPLNGSIDLEIMANDPDFALRWVKLSATSANGPLFDKLLLDDSWRGQFVKKFRFEPGKLGLKAGDVVEYFAVAEDNKEDNKHPAPNRTETAKKTFRVVSPSAERKPDEIAKNGQQQGHDREPGGEQNAGGNDDHPRDNEDPRLANKPLQPGVNQQDEPGEAQPQDGNKQGNERDQNAAAGGAESQGAASQGADRDGKQGNESAGESGQRPSGEGERSGEKNSDDRTMPKDTASKDTVPNDGSDDGDAIEQILKHRDEQNPAPKQADGQQQPDSNKDGKPSGQKGDSQSGAEGQGDKNGQKKPSPQDGKSDSPQDKHDQAQESGGNKNRQQQEDRKPGDKQDQGGQKQGDKKDQNKKPEANKGERGASDQSGDDPAPGANGPQDDQGKQGASKNSKPGGQSGRSDAGKDAEPDQPGGPGKASGEKPAGKSSKERSNDSTPDKSAGDQPGKADDDPASDTQSGQESAAKRDANRMKGDPTAKDREPDGGKEQSNSPSGKKDRTSTNQPRQGERSKGDPTADGDKKPSPDRPSDDTTGGDSEKEKGESGAGQSGQESKGAPSPLGDNQPSEKSKSAKPDDADAKKDDNAQSPSNSKQESDSEGRDDGDRSGGGKRGGGQKANKSGTGGAGQNTPADEGAGRSDESGKGETSDRAGADQQSNKPTGQSGSKPGSGSKSKPSDSSKGEQEPDATSEGKPSPSDSSRSGGQGQDSPSGAQGASQAEGGEPADGKTAPEKWRPRSDAAEQANLDYARKATDLALEHLKDQLKKDQPDPELLKRLGWTRGDLEKFVKRWEQMQKQARSPLEDRKASRDLDETLRSLGLRPHATTLRGNAGRDDQSHGLKESRRSGPPPEYAEQYKAYTQGTARGAK